MSDSATETRERKRKRRWIKLFYVLISIVPLNFVLFKIIPGRVSVWVKCDGPCVPLVTRGFCWPEAAETGLEAWECNTGYAPFWVSLTKVGSHEVIQENSSNSYVYIER
jgi:hypothetical protein